MTDNKILKGEIKQYKKQGYKNEDIKNYVIARGYDEKEVNMFFRNESIKEYMIIIVPLVLVLIFSFILLFSNGGILNFGKDSKKDIALNNSIKTFQPQNKTTTYTESFDPNDWIEKDAKVSKSINGEVGTLVTISVEKATTGTSSYIAGQQRILNMDGSVSSIFFTGYYLGEPFSRAYYLENETGQPIPESVKMRIGNDMHPNDEIMEAFAVMKNDFDGYALYIFVDDDFKEELNSDVNIVWSKDVNVQSLFHEKTFDFTKYSDGVYYTRISEDVTWMLTSIVLDGKVYVGDMTKEEIISKNGLDKRKYITID